MPKEKISEQQSSAVETKSILERDFEEETGKIRGHLRFVKKGVTLSQALIAIGMTASIVTGRIDVLEGSFAVGAIGGMICVLYEGSLGRRMARLEQQWIDTSTGPDTTAI